MHVPSRSANANRTYGTIAVRASLFLGLLAAVLFSASLFVAFLQDTLLFLAFGGRVGLLDGGVVLQCGVFGYFTVALLIRLVRRNFTWPGARQVASDFLLFYARGWGIGVAILMSNQIAGAIRGTVMPPIASAVDVVFFVVVAVLFALPALVALAIGRKLQP